MSENTPVAPLLEKSLNDQKYGSYTPPDLTIPLPSSPSTPFTFSPANANNANDVNDTGESRTSGLEALNSIVNKASANDDGKLTGGSPIFSIAEATNDRYKNYAPGEDNEESHAKAQGILDRWGNALVKTAAFTLGTFAQGFGTIPNTIRAIKNGKLSELSNPTGYENDIDVWLKNIEDVFPNYYSKWEQEHPFLSAIPFSGGATNFWSDKFMKNIGFTIGAIGSAVAQDAIVGTLTAGLGEIPTMASQVGKASLWLNKVFGGANKIDRVLTLGEELGKTSEQLLNIKKLAQAAAGIRVTDKGRYLINLYGAARTEGAMEARDGYRTLKTDLTKQYVDKNGVEPEGKDLEDIDNTATAAMNTRLGINLALLMVSDAVQWDNMLRPFNSSKWGLKSSVAKSLENGQRIGLKEGSLDEFERKASNNISSRILSKVKSSVPSVLSEGVYEEGGQYAAQIGTYDYYNNKYKFKHGNPDKKETWDNLKEIIGSTVEGLSQEFGTTEGLENIFLGGLTGALTGGARNIFDRSEDKNHAAIIANLLNSEQLTGILENKYNSALNTLQAKKDIISSVKNNNVFEFKNLKHQEFFNFINSGIQAGRFDVRLEQLNMLKELDDNQFNSMFGIDNNIENKKSASQYVDKLIEKATDIKNIHNAIESTFENPFNKVRTPKNSEQLLEVAKYNTFENWKSELTYLSSVNSDGLSRIRDIESQITNIAPIATDTILKAFDGKEKDTNKIIEGIEKEYNITIPKHNIPVLAKLGYDLVSLSKRNDKASKLYEYLSSSKGIDKYFEESNKEDENQEGYEPTEENVGEENKPDAKLSISNYLSSVKETNPALEGISNEYSSLLTSHNANLSKAVENINNDINDHIQNLTEQIKDVEDNETKSSLEEDIAKLKEIKDKIKEFVDSVEIENEFTPEKKINLQKLQAGIVTKVEDYTTPNLSQEEFPREEPKKNLYQLINSTSEPVAPSLRLPYMDRHQSFLSNFDTLPNKGDIQAIKVTRSNEAAWGLTGLTALINNGYLSNDKLTDKTDGIVAVVYVTKGKDGKVSLIDKNGKIIKDDLVNNAVYSVMGNARPLTVGGKEKIRNNEDPEEVKLAFKAYEEERENTFKRVSKEDTHIHNFTISAGRVIVDKGAKNPVVGSLLNKEQLNQKGLLKISTTGEISNNNGEIRKVAKGTPAIVTPSGIYFLNNRLFNIDEARNITDILKKLAEEFHKTGSLNPAIIRYLGGQFQWKVPGPSSIVANNQMYIDNLSQQIVIGTTSEGKPDYLSYFHPDAIEKNRDKIEAILQNKYNNVNNKFLTTEFEQPYNELSVNDKNELVSKEWKSYQEYLLSDEGRTTPPLTTRVRMKQKDNVVQNDYNILKYSTLEDLEVPSIGEKKAGIVTGVLQPTEKGSFDDLKGKGRKQALFTSVSNQNTDTEAKKADIERRRQEELNEYKDKDVSKVDEFTFTDEEGNITYVQVRNYPNGKRVVYQGIEKNKYGNVNDSSPFEISKEQTTEDYLKVAYPENTFGKYSKTGERTGEEASLNTYSRKINAKYDAELASLENKPIVDSNSEIESKKANIERRRQEELDTAIFKNGINRGRSNENLFKENNALVLSRQWPTSNVESAKKLISLYKEINAKYDAELAALKGNTKTFTLSQGENISYTTNDKGEINLTNDAELSKAIERIKTNNKDAVEAARAEMKEANLPTDDESVIKQIIITQIQNDVPLEKIEKPAAIVEDVSLADIRKSVKPGIKFKPKSEYKIVSSLDVPRMSTLDHAKFNTWMKENLPNVPVERVNNIIQKTGGGYAWGVFEDGMIKIFSNAERGTEYHEAFEAVWNSFLSEQEQKDILSEYRKTHKGVEELSDNDIKEKIADDFGDYVLSPSPTTIGAKIRKFFNDLISFFKGLINKQGATEKLFKRINTGYYSAEEVNGNSQAAYHSIKDLSQEIVNETIDHVTASIMRDLAENTSSFFPENLKNINLAELYDEAKVRLFDSIDGIINNKFTKLDNTDSSEKLAIEQEIKNLYTTKLNIDKQWNKIIYEQIDYLRAFNINVDDSDEQANVNDDDRSGVDFNRDVFKVDVKTSAPSAIKLLFATLTNNIASQEVKEGQVLQLPEESTSLSIGGMQTASFGKSFIQVMEALTGQNNIYNQIDKLVDLAKKEPNYVKLFKRLRGSLVTGKIDFSKLNSNDWRLLISFYNAFTKQKPISFLQYVSKDGTYIQEADLNNVIANTISSWIPSIRNNVNKENSIINYNEKTSTFSINKKAIISISNPYQQVALLKRIGIPFTIEQYNEIKQKDETQPREYPRLREFADAISSIRSTLSTLPNTNKLTQKWLSINKPLNIISRLTNSLEVPEESSVLFDGNNEMRQKYVLHNYLSVFANDFNNVNTLDELLQTKRYLNDVFSKNSLTLKKGGEFFDEQGNRTSKKLQIGNILSSLDTTNGKNTELSKLSLQDRLMLEFNMNLKGWSYNLSTSDSGTEWLLSLGNTIPETSFFLPNVWENVSSIFKGYLNDEISLIQENRKDLKYTEKNGNRLRFMGDVLRPSTVSAIEAAIKSNKIDDYLAKTDKDGKKINEDKIDGEIKDYFIRKSEGVISSLTNSNKILISLTGKSFEVPGLDNSHKTKMNEQELKALFQFLTVNNTINTFELHKIYYGDPFQFKIKYDSKTGKPTLDETKRIKSSGSSKELPFNTPEFDNFANIEYNKSGRVSLDESDIGYTKFKPYANTVTIKDINVRGSLADENSNYSEVNEADASGWQSFPFYRQMERKRGTFSDLAEEFYQYDMAAARRYFDAHPDYDYKYSSEDLRSIDDTLLSSKRPDYKVDVKKPLAYGPEYDKDNNTLIFDKDSEVPLTFELAQFGGKNMLDIFFKLHNDKASDGNARDYFIVESGRKVGVPIDSDNLYANDGSTNKEPFKTDTKVDLDNKGTQVESAYKEKKQTLGKQMRVLSLQDIFDKGKPISEELGNLAKSYTNTLNNLTTYGYNNILSLFGIIDKKDHFEIEDKSILAETLRGELLKQAVSDNVKQAIRLNDNGEFSVPFEATNVYDKIKGIVNSVVNRNLISQKVNGSAKTQVTSTLFERNNREAVYRKGNNWVKVEDYDKLTPAEQKTVTLTSNELKFYPVDKDKDGKIVKVYHMEVYLPRWFANKSLMSDEELINHLNSTKEGQKVLKGIGFRIPTQKKNSIEAFIVKGFLPQSMGNSIVLPSEITMKSGSDFDFDKLNTYLKNVTFDKKGIPSIAKREDIEDTNDEEQLRDFYERNILEQYKRFKLKENEVSVKEAATKLFKDIFAEEDSLDERSPLQELKNKYVPSIDEFINAVKGKDAGFINQEYNPNYKAVLENEFFQATEDLILHPEMYERLIKPNEGGGIFPKLRDKIIEALGNDSGLRYPSMIDIVYRSTMRHNAASASGGIGIVATNITLYTKLQAVNSYLNPAKLLTLSKGDKVFVPNLNILLDHNTTDVNGSKLPTFSALRDVSKGYISDNLSNLADGMVDITKDPWITELFGDNSNIHSTAIFMTMLGMKPQSIAYFLNQPIVREYRKSLSSNGKTYMLDKDTRDKMRDKFASSFAKPSKISEANLLSNIEKYYKDKNSLNNNEKAEQQLILDEFLKYVSLSNHLYGLNSALSYDSKLRGNSSYDTKRINTDKQRTVNLISGIDDVLDNSFIGPLADNLGSTHDALSEVFPLMKSDIRNMFNSIRSSIDVKFMKNSIKETIADGIQKSFIDYLLNTQTKYFTQDINKLLIDPKTSVATQMKEAIDDGLNNNFVNALSEIADRKGLYNIKLNRTDTDVFTTNSYIASFRQLKQQDRDLYNNLIKLAIIQSGTQISKLAYSHLIPIEDYQLIAGDIISKIDIIPNIKDFQINHAYFRNNWNNSNIVPIAKGEAIFTRVPQSIQKLSSLTGSKFIQAHPDFGNKSSYPVLKTVTYTRDSNGKSVPHVTLYQKVMEDVQNQIPFITNDGQFIYKQINGWGDSIYLQEYYANPRASQYTNSNLVRIDNELVDKDIVNAYTKGLAKSPQGTVTNIADNSVPLKEDMNTTPDNDITFNEKQVQTIKETQDFLRNGDPNTYHVIEGKAGTGKTTIVKEIIKPFRDDKRIVIAALAHKAKSVLLQKINKGEDNKVGGYSIASLLGMSMDNETGKFTSDNSFSMPPITTSDIIIIDEASMVNEDALFNIMNDKPKNAKVIFIGDKGQLPPIREQGDKNENDISPVFKSANKSLLTERVRQGEESPILPYADNYWDNSTNSQKVPARDPIKPSDRVNKITAKGNILFSRNFASVKDFAVQEFKKAIDTFNPNVIKIVTYKNVTRMAINNAIREAIFNKPAQFEKGDILMFQDGYTAKINGKDVGIENSTEVSLTGIRTIEEEVDGKDGKVKLSIYELTGKDSTEGKANIFKVLDKKDKPAFDAIVSHLFNVAKGLKGKDRFNALQRAWSMKRKYADVDYGYAITSHKSQGSTYETVIVDENDIQSVGATTNRAKSQSMYTGITRASKSAIILYGANKDTSSEDISKIVNQNNTDNNNSFSQYGPDDLPKLNDENQNNC